LQPRQVGEVPGGKRSNHHTIASSVIPWVTVLRRNGLRV
jgi:hypothetical protein